MIKHVMNRTINIPNIEKTFLCTDNRLIANEAAELPINVIFKSGNFSSGTDRINNSIPEILEDLRFDNSIGLENLYLINIQADQPFISKAIVNEFISNINKMGNPELVTSFYKKKYNSIDFGSDLVKVTISKKSNRVLYFSRSIIPFYNSFNINNIQSSKEYFLNCHIGVYAYRFDILKLWSKLSISYLEEVESLEQLRWLDHDINMYAFEHFEEVISVDNKDQLEYARSLINYYSDS